MAKSLLLISADVEKVKKEVERGESPRRDYLEVADAIGADILDRRAVDADPFAERLDRVLRRGIGHAWLASKLTSHYDTIFTDGEHIGLPLGFLIRRREYRPRHVTIGHGISAWRKRILAGVAKDGLDAMIVHCSTQLDFAINRLGMDHSRVYLLPYQVDTDFWHPLPESEDLMIVSCGLEHRDYKTLVKAVLGLPVGVVIAAMSPWSQDRNHLQGMKVPPNVTVGAYRSSDLRYIYGRSRFVVVPLRDNIYPAGIATILEAMSMGKAVIVTQTRGQRDTVVGPLWSAGETSWPESAPSPDDSTGIYVPPGDPEALRSAILYLLGRPEMAALIGRNGRKYVTERASLHQFVSRLAAVVDPAYAPRAIENAGPAK